MNDLSGLTWDAAPSHHSKNDGTTISYAALQPPVPIARRSLPLSTPSPGNTPMPDGRPPLNSSGHDSFSSLLSSNSVKSTNSLSLHERQKALLDEQARQVTEQKRRHDSVFQVHDSQFWEDLGSGRGTPVAGGSSNTDRSPSALEHDDDDILAVFHSSESVLIPSDSSRLSVQTTRAEFTPSQGHSQLRKQTQEVEPGNSIRRHEYSADDDSFGLKQMPQKALSNASISASMDEDDILGELGRPAPIETLGTQNGHPAREKSHATNGDHPADKAVAELMEMGFPMRRCQEALEKTTTGMDFQAAVGWLLREAHEQSGSKPGLKNVSLQPGSERRGREDQQNGDHESTASEAFPAWMRAQPRQERAESRSSASSEKDVAQYASAIGTTIFKSANTLWKTGQKKVQKVVVDLQHTNDSAEPRWMREAPKIVNGGDQVLESHPKPRERQRQRETNGVTDEAMMLESGRSVPRQRSRGPGKLPNRPDSEWGVPTRRRSSSEKQRPMEQAFPGSHVVSSNPRIKLTERLNRQSVEEQTSKAYISPARRRKPPSRLAEQDVTSPSANAETSHSTKASAVNSIPPISSTPYSNSPGPTITRRTIPTRQIPPMSPSALLSSTSSRQKGTAAFKRGDYTEAFNEYSSSLSLLPEGHPVTIVIRCNRALTNIKTGDPKAAVADANAALATIGSSRGEGEIIALGGTEGEKPMKDFFGKALTRKAEALEHMEKWHEAGKVWREAIEAGVGSAVAIQGRNRCEKASAAAAGISTSPHPSVTSHERVVSTPRKPQQRFAATYLNGTTTESEAIQRLRAANAAAVIASDEAFALTDAVDARLTSWKAGKSDNLRALLATLDIVLWPEAGWTKVGMSDLVLPNRVKVIYMKAISKVHPDKISQTATTEQRMVSSSVFATLNEAWDKFKRDNGL